MKAKQSSAAAVKAGRHSVDRIVGLISFPLVCVRWVDSHYRPGWDTSESASDPVECVSIGWLIHNGKTAKTLSANISREDCPQRCGDMTIPSRAILEIIKIK
jgi:hypothetical protein